MAIKPCTPEDILIAAYAAEREKFNSETLSPQAIQHLENWEKVNGKAGWKIVDKRIQLVRQGEMV